MIEYISRGGNYACAVPIDPEGGMDPECVAMLKDMGAWMKVNGDAVYGSKAWHKWGEGNVVMPNGPLSQHQVDTPYTAADIRFTEKDGKVYAWLMAWPEDGMVTIRSLATAAGDVTSVRLLGDEGSRKFQQTAEGLTLTLVKQPCQYAWCLEVSGKNLKPAP